MAFLGLIVTAVAKLLHILINVYSLVLVGRVIFSWVKPDPYNPIVRFLYQITEPLLSKVRRLLPASFFHVGFDLSPLIVFILLMLFETIVVGSLDDLAYRLRFE